ncbi:MAG TPA: hypothetical protein VFZ76_15355 [Anaerolineales bacterium]
MRRFLSLFGLIMMACQVMAPAVTQRVPAVPDAPVPTLTASASATALHLPLPSQTVVPTVKPEETFSSRFHPDGDLFVTDLISLEIIAPPGEELQDHEVAVRVIDPVRQDLGEAEFQPFGIGGRRQATMQWVWDTSELSSDEYTLEFSVRPEGPEWTETVSMRPQAELPPPQPGAQWETTESECCRVHYITGTEAARDISALAMATDEQAESVAEKFGAEFEGPVTLTLLPRVLGHGGFAGEEIYISYLDRNYAGNDYTQVLHHELVHILDNHLGGELRPSILVEGLAVYLSGGHFKREAILARAATLLDLGWYIPLKALSDDFYTAQHEIGYIEAGALVEFMVRTYGWEAFSDFYRDIRPPENGEQSQAIDRALQEHFGITFAQLEDRLLASLRRRAIIPELRSDVRLTVAFYNTVRRYQQLMDPSAYFLTAWLPSGEEMRQRGIVADYLRHPMTAENIALESMLVEADKHLRAGRYAEAEQLISAVNLRLSQLGEVHVDPLMAQ